MLLGRGRGREVRGRGKGRVSSWGGTEVQTDTREVCVEVCARCLCLWVGVCCEVPWRCGEVWQGVAGVWQGCGEAVTTALPAAYLGKDWKGHGKG